MEEHLIIEQAGFRPGKSCTSQLMNLTQFMEYGHEEGVITGAAFVHLSAAYDTVNHRILVRKVFEIIQDVRFIELVQDVLSNVRLLWTSSANTADGACRRMAYHMAAYRSNHLKIILWKRLLVTHSQARLHSTLSSISKQIQRQLR